MVSSIGHILVLPEPSLRSAFYRDKLTMYYFVAILRYSYLDHSIGLYPTNSICKNENLKVRFEIIE